jgi:hypothetical protein
MTRDELEQLDTKRLRALAKERFARKARALRTRGALLEALTRTLAPPLPPLAAPRGTQTRKPRAPRRAGGEVGPLPTSAAPPQPSSPGPLRPVLPPPFARSPPPSLEEGPVEEGFFIGRPVERKPPRRPAPPSEAEPEAAPVSPLAPEPLPLGDDVPHLLARDATTLFLFWDFRRDLEHGAAFGLRAPRIHFRLYDGESWVRTLEAPLGRRSLYLESLEPGHLYSVEAWLAGSDGHARPTGRRSAAVRLAPAAPSGRLEVRLSRLPWGQPLADWRPPLGAEDAPVGQRLAPPARVELPASLDWRGGQAAGGPKSGRP